MDKILSKSKSMIFGRKKAKEDNTIRDSESFYDLDDYSFSSPSPRQTPTVGLKSKNTLPTKPFAQIAHSTHAPGPLQGEKHNFYNSSFGTYTSRRETQPVLQLRQKSLPLGRSSSTSETKPPVLSLNALAGERYKLDVNFDRGRTTSTASSQGVPLRNIGHSASNHLTNTSKSEIPDNTTRGGIIDMKPTGRASSCQLPDKSFRGCAISAPITNGLLSLETKFDPSTNRSNVQVFRSSADNVLAKHIPTSSVTFANRPGISNNQNPDQGISRGTGPPGGGFSPLRGRRSLNSFNNATTQTSNSEISTTSSNNEKRNLSSLFPRSSATQGSTTSGFSSSSDTHYGALSNWVRYESQNNARSECIISKITSPPTLGNDSGENTVRRPFHSRAASDNLTQLNPVQPLSLRSQPKMQKKTSGFPDPLLEGKEKQNTSSNVYGSSVLQASASLPTPPTSTTTLSFIAGQLDIPEFEGEKQLGLSALEDNSKYGSTGSPPLTRSELESALKIQEEKLSELSEGVRNLTEQLNEETTSRKLFERRISHLENEIRGLRWIISEKDRKGSEVKTIGCDSRGSSSQIASGDSSSRYEASRASNTTEKDTTERSKDQDREGGRTEMSAESGMMVQHDPNSFNVTLKSTQNRRKRFGLALDFSPDSTTKVESSPPPPPPLRSSLQPRVVRHHAGKV